MTVREQIMEHYGTRTEAATLAALDAEMRKGVKQQEIADRLGVHKAAMSSAVQGMRRRVAAGQELGSWASPDQHWVARFESPVDVPGMRRSDRMAAMEWPLSLRPSWVDEMGRQWKAVGPFGEAGAGRPRGIDGVRASRNKEGYHE